MFDCDVGGGARHWNRPYGRNVAAVIEISLTEWRRTWFIPAGIGRRDRLTAAALAGVPQVVVMGGLDGAVVPGPADAERIFAGFAGRWFGRTSPEENDRLGREVAYKVRRAAGQRRSSCRSAAYRHSMLRVNHSGIWWPMLPCSAAYAIGSTRTCRSTRQLATCSRPNAQKIVAAFRQVTSA